MALLYRAVWCDSVGGSTELASATFREWVQHKRERWGLKIEPPDGDGRSEGEGPDCLASWIEATPGSGGAKRLRLVEQGENETYTTTLTVTDSQDPTSWWWLDLERDADDPFQSHATIAPHLATLLLTRSREQGGDARLGEIRLTPKPVGLEPVALKAIIERSDRKVPIVVFSHDPTAPPAVTSERAKQAAIVMAGTALVVVLADAHVDQFKDLIGDDMAVWGGAVRIYLPASDSVGLSPRRHRYFERWRLSGKPRDAALRIAAEVASAVASRRPPAPLAGLDWGQASNDEWIAALEADNQKLVGIEQIAAERAEEIRQITDELRLLRRSFQSVLSGRQGDNGASAYEPWLAISDELPTMSEVIDAAVAELQFVEIHPDAPRELEELDTHALGREWAEKTRLALLSLDGYAQNRGEPGNYSRFDWWCNANSNAMPFIWPSTRFAETETGETKTRFGSTRDFPVSTELDESGIKRMYVHLKISNEWPLAPRLYFCDDSRGVTGKVHVGFIGPHRLVPNTQTST